MKRILVTGGAGFIGSHFVKYALRTHPDWYIVNLDKLTYAGNRANLPDDQRHEFVHGDIADHALLAGLWKEGFDIVVNFAAETHVDRSWLGADEFIRTDVLGTFILLKAARQFGVGRFLHISTDEVYGETLTGAATEDAPLRPRNPYAASKAAADLLTQTAGVPAIITRCTNNFGTHQHVEKFIPLFITNALTGVPLPLYGDGRQVRDWIYVADHCAALDLILERGALGETYNIAAGHAVENIVIARHICQRLGKPDTLIRHVSNRPDHDRRYALDTGKLAQLGWQPPRDFLPALDATIDWYVSHPEWWQPVRQGEFQQYYRTQYGSPL